MLNMIQRYLVAQFYYINKVMKRYEELSLNEQLLIHGIETIRDGVCVLLKLNNKTILRPNANRCYDIVLREFGVDLKKNKKWQDYK